MFARKTLYALVVTALLALLWVPTAAAGCKITVGVKNTGSSSFIVDWGQSKLKVKGGLWKKIAKNSKETVKPGKTATETFTALFNCGASRRYQFHTIKGGSTKTTYNPSASGWTKSNTPTSNVSM